MRELSDEEILAVWADVTDFTDGWEEAISEYLERIEEMKAEFEPEARGKLEELKEELINIRREIEETVERARQGEIDKNELENTFRTLGEMLSEIETRLLEIEFEPEEFEEWGEEEEEEY